jgi:hypothetical protein
MPTWRLLVGFRQDLKNLTRRPGDGEAATDR